MRTILALILATATSAQAAVIGVAEAGDGSVIRLHDTPGACVGQARHAEFVSTGGERIPGCWISNGTLVAVAFLDGDHAQIPVAALRPEKKS